MHAQRSGTLMRDTVQRLICSSGSSPLPGVSGSSFVFMGSSDGLSVLQDTSAPLYEIVVENGASGLVDA
jgi:hypothetical protein